MSETKDKQSERIDNRISEILHERHIAQNIDKDSTAISFMAQLREIEVIREDIDVKVGDLRPLPVNPTGPVAISYHGEEWFLNDHSLSQYLDASPAGLRRKEFEAFRGQTDLPVFNINGEPVENSNYAFNYLMHVPASRPKMERVFRTIDDQVAGFVGKDYPLWWSDFQAVNSLVKNFSETSEGGLVIDRPKISRIGTVKFNFYDPARTFEVRRSTGRFSGNDSINYGGSYSRNPNGGGVLGVGGYWYREICTNGMIGVAPTLFSSVAHLNETYFNTELGKYLQAFVPLEIEEEPAYANLVDELLAGNRPIDTMTSDFYDLWGKASVELIEQTYDYLVTVVKAGNELVVEDYKKEIEAQAEFYGMKRKSPYFLELAKSDPTIDLEEFSLWDMANVFTAWANDPKLDADSQSDLMGVGFDVLKRAEPMTPLIKA